MHVLQTPSIWSRVTIDLQILHCQSSFIFVTYELFKAFGTQVFLVDQLKALSANFSSALVANTKTGMRCD
ncbi:hypothetical protein DSQ19_02965 [Candidatus Nitrosotenuis sp. DW1]|nr:hypothetical protein DSQ19_02965 [Candidatus Nitrosotenuis sp. DW1]